MKRIVVLDGYALNPGDLDWQALKALGEVTVYDRTSVAEVPERAKDAEIVLTNKAIVNSTAINELKHLEYVGVMATGYNVVDIPAAKAKGITVTNVPAYSSDSVAQLTFALILELCHHVGLHAESVRAGEWSRSADFSYWKTPLRELAGSTLGIVGLGQIGRAVAKIALAFNMKVIASHKHPERDAMQGVTFTDLASCFKEADIVSLHCPLTADNKEFVNAALLKTMKPGAFLINTSRGPLINETDLARALEEGVIAGAALDVLSTEPPAADNPLPAAPNTVITPHIAWATRSARERLLNGVVNNLKAYLEGKPVNVI
ncbi:glycerate dehydrogenase [Chitinophaga terrae (ex Kim and Jung 2007)]|uniref:D-2-hydroxyacid dehydrogenase n=1 Tax=Chitinophaga terrae (ex Kim and Jung 2007) TaxID=408074 RepID=UPI00278164D2|nr:D-2-hydroxyacid dehydrogenase [Chitinophaga terrae (ex Kim and Jung 2007)]MDQ0105971.1 glycerate dehydrogenase [Chitinophaga terrae (ex Kim and Jung 2007)]